MAGLDFENERLIQDLIRSGGLKSKSVIEAFREVPRHLFVMKEHLRYAYINEPLPIGNGQTISQPYTVAVMLEALGAGKGDNVLEIGTGSGWSASLLSRIVGKSGKVTTLEVFPKLVDFAKKNIKKIGLKNIEVVLGDGKQGFASRTPYDRVLINAACDRIPTKVDEQVKVGGRIVAPINSFFAQRMMVYDKISSKKFVQKDLGSFIFVPLL
ncbi:protein-L-isoaspartate O-methyltransferase [Candidatus Micrarchaeota archaeon RBG_16_49_10]|nr:MAG: protein-L-isoaspartate O-methyltransferase [Candidatus Micrarchaeota archaeon RBG_16_49_10]